MGRSCGVGAVDRRGRLWAAPGGLGRNLLSEALVRSLVVVVPAELIAERLQLEYIERFTGYGELATSLAAVARMPGIAGAIRVLSPSWPR